MAWYTAGSGATCVAAYNPTGASSLANSYVNLANPGTNDAAPGTAPTWAHGTGWLFNGTTQYLTTGLAPGNQYSIIVRFSGFVANAGATSVFMGGQINSGAFTGMVVGATQTTTTRRYRNGNTALVGSAISASGVICVAGDVGYWNGASDVTGLGGNGGSIHALYIGANNLGGVAATFSNVSIAAAAIYSSALTGADVAAITTAMLALPVAGLLPSMLQHAAMGWR